MHRQESEDHDDRCEDGRNTAGPTRRTCCDRDFHTDRMVLPRVVVAAVMTTQLAHKPADYLP